MQGKKVKSDILHININGLAIRYLIIGHGKPVFFLHGWGGNIDSWNSIISEISEGKFCLIAMDMPGFGESDEPRKPWGVEEYAIFVSEFVQKIYSKYGLSGKYKLVVHSFGARVALKMAELGLMGDADYLAVIAGAGVLRPQPKIRRLIYVFVKLVSKSFKRMIPEPIFKLCSKILYKLLGVHDYQNTSGVMRETFKKVIAEDSRQSIALINCTTHIFWGDKDSYVPVDDGRIFNEAIKDSKLTVFNNAKHDIHKSHAKEISRVILKEMS